MNERIWNADRMIPYEEFIQNLAQTDGKLSILIGDERQDNLLYDYNFVKEDN